MSGPSVYPLFMTCGTTSTATTIEVEALNLTVVENAVTMPVDGQIKLLVLPDADDELQVENQGTSLKTTSGAKLMET